MSKMRCFCKYRNSQRVNQPVQDDSSSSGRPLLHLIPKNFCLVWEKDRGVGVRRKDDIHAAVFSSSLESGERRVHLPLGLGSETSRSSWKPQGRGNGAEELRVLFGLYDRRTHLCRAGRITSTWELVIRKGKLKRQTNPTGRKRNRK